MAPKIGSGHKREIVRQYLKRPSSRTKHVRELARELAAKFPKDFASVETARAQINTLLGRGGRRNRRQADPELIRPMSKTTRPRWCVPAPWRPLVPHDPYVVKASRTLALYDLHCPWHSSVAVTAAIRYGLDHGADHILLGGDFMDNYAVSSYERSPVLRDLPREIQAVREMLDTIRSAFPDATITYREGNHERRLPRYLSCHCVELWGFEFMGLPSMLGLADYGVDWVQWPRPVHVGRLPFIHGDEFSGGGVNPARAMYLRTGSTGVCGHFHRRSQHTEPIHQFHSETERSEVECYSVGCLCQLRGTTFAPLNKWTWGFGFCEVERDGTWHFSNLLVRPDGRVVS